MITALKEEIKTSESNTGENKISRQDFLKKISLVSMYLLSGCSQLNYLIGNYPSKFKEENETNDLTLRTFVTTVIPGADKQNPDLTKIFTDEYYSFNKVCGFFISDLSSRSKNYFGVDDFNLLSIEKRNAVINSGLNGDSIIKKIYTAAVFMAQISYYSGVYTPDSGCDLIDFQGSNCGYADDEMYYRDTEKYLAAEITRNGNYN